MKKKLITYSFVALSIAIVLFTIFIYKIRYSTEVVPQNGKAVLLLPTGSSYSQVKDTLKSHLIIRNWEIVDLLAKKKKYTELIKPGRYVIERSLSYLDLINRLRGGEQTPVKLTFNNITTLNNLAGKIGSQIEADSTHLIVFFTSVDNYRKDGFTRETIISLFIPNTYELYWNTSAAGLYNRMLKEYRKFWNEDRLSKAHEKNLSQVEVSILASIIDDEASKADEKPRIAGVYLNRIRKGIPLQADPTIKFALNDFLITRILFKHLEVNSPYNTYKHSGFPPGPIGCPTIEGIDAVLNAEKSDYLFFVARPDFSGYHNFSRTLAEHNRNAFLYQKELNKRKIFK
jgi:UPF0755 protein